MLRKMYFIVTELSPSEFLEVEEYMTTSTFWTQVMPKQVEINYLTSKGVISNMNPQGLLTNKYFTHHVFGKQSSTIKQIEFHQNKHLLVSYDSVKLRILTSFKLNSASVTSLQYYFDLIDEWTGNNYTEVERFCLTDYPLRYMRIRAVLLQPYTNCKLTQTYIETSLRMKSKFIYNIISF